MSIIKQLSPHEAQKIAAGEVVERPANIVKELIENALDAQATQITLYVEDGGKKLIRIVDNGCGMSPEDAQLCFKQYATSKISSVNELESINTFGFRGEALASIAAVSKITLTTKLADAREGTKVIIHGGVMQEQTVAACTTGTDITIHNLFFNIPARQKFLKKTTTEWRHVQQLFHAFCFDYPHIHFTLFSEGKKVLNCPSIESKNSTARCAQIWEHNTAQQMLALEATHEIDTTLQIAGVISNHQHYRYDRNNIFLFVNRRWVKNQHLSRALLKGYLNVIPHGRYPAAIIHITVDPTTVDINIHPRKEEIKFLHPRRIEQLIQRAVKQTLEKNLSSQISQNVKFQINRNPTQQATYPEPQAFKSFEQPIRFLQQASDFAKASPDRQDERIEEPSTAISPEQDRKIKENEQALQSAISANNFSPAHPECFSEKNVSRDTDYKLLTQFQKTYLLIEKENGLFLVDQHAAHERILYELFSTRFDKVATVQLIFPQMISLTKLDLQTLEPHLHIFQKNGIGIEPFGTNQLRVQSTPVHLKDQSLDDLVQQVLAWIKEYQSLDQEQFFKTINEKLHAQMACKAAVKAGDVLTTEKMEQLLRDLATTPNRFTCPHGRPTGWLLSIDDIEKKFKRRL